MQKQKQRRCSISRMFGWIQAVLGVLVVVVSIASLARFYSAGFFLRDEDLCKHFYTQNTPFVVPTSSSYSSGSLREIQIRVQELYTKVDSAVKEMDKSIESKDPTLLKSEYDKYRKFMTVEVKASLDEVKMALERIEKLAVKEQQQIMKVENLERFFTKQELKLYVGFKENKIGRVNMLGVNGTYSTIGHGCIATKKDLEEYMSYDVGGYCKDDWHLGQKLMLQGCDPLPRRRCLARAPKLYQKPYPMEESLWRTPDDRNVRWTNYQCKSFACLASNATRKGFSKCSGCFNLAQSEVPKWVRNSSMTADFTVKEIINVKPGEIRIGLDFSVGVGTFAARMREHNVTVVSSALNLGAPFSEMISLRGLVPLYIGINQRLPFFDNTLDLIHTGGFLDSWIDLQLLDFVVFDWDRVLRPGGLLWVDKFFCTRTDLDDYLYMFLQLRYKKHKWVVVPKTNTEVYFSALLEKPPRPF